MLRVELCIDAKPGGFPEPRESRSTLGTDAQAVQELCDPFATFPDPEVGNAHLCPVSRPQPR